MTTSAMPYLECVGGPFDGSSLPAFAPTIAVKQFERSPYLHLYVRVREDDGTSFWAYRGDTLATEAPAA